MASEASRACPITNNGRAEFFIGFSRAKRLEARVARMRQAIWNAAHWHELSRPKERSRVWFVTLTYAANTWRPEHIKRYLVRLRDWARSFGVSARYCWVAELQQRGVIHYHVAVWLPRGLSLPKPDRCGWWSHGLSQRALAIAPVGYLMKYASKGMGGDGNSQLPPGARIFGVGGLCPSGRAVGAWLGLPEWAKRLRGVGGVQRRPGHLVVPQTGELLASPWVCVRSAAGVLLRCVGEMAERWFSGPYSSWEPVT